MDGNSSQDPNLPFGKYFTFRKPFATPPLWSGLVLGVYNLQFFLYK